MLRASYTPMLSEQDQHIFDILVPADHYLRQVNALVDFERYRPMMAVCYHASDGRPATDSVLLLKVGFLQTHYNLSDREVLAAIQVNVAFRFFLKLALTDTLPHPSLLTIFRARLGATLYQQIFDGVVGQARAAGLVKDRLRLKDATHVIANIAIPSTIRLIAPMRERLLSAAEQERCLKHVAKANGRIVVVNDYAAEYAAARQKVTTPGYQQVRREHRAIERKLAEVVRQHDGRRARYRGRSRLSIQYLLTGLVVNVKRMVRLLLGSPPPQERCAMV